MADVTLNLASGPGEPMLVLVKVQTSAWEFNFRATPEDLAALGAIRDTDWARRKCLHVGESAGAPVHWAAEGDNATILIGDDDETWDIALMVPVVTVDEIVTQSVTGAW
jgi:hypothetical protein